MSYTYFVTESAKGDGLPPYKKTMKRTRGEYSHTTGPIGCFGFCYAIFRNKSSEVLVPVHDLTPATARAIFDLQHPEQEAPTP